MRWFGYRSHIQEDFHDIDIPIFRDIESNYTFKVGDLFQTKDILLQTLRTWSIRRCATYKTKKSNSISFEAVCALHGSVSSDTSIEANAHVGAQASVGNS